MQPARLFTRGLRCLALLASLANAIGASAETLYTQPLVPTDNGGYWASTPGGFLQYDSFVLAQNSTIQTVTWLGMDLNELIEATPVNPSSFTVGIYANDAQGLPGSLLSFSTIDASAGATLTGEQVLGLSVYRYTGTLDSPLEVAAGTTYWLGISDPTLTNGNWFWASTSSADGTHVGNVGGSFGPYADDLSFSLEGTVGTVPEPASQALLLLGIAGLVGLRARLASRTHG